MRTNLIITFILLVSSFSMIAQSTDVIVSEIEERAEQTMLSSAGLDTTFWEFWDLSAEGGEAIGYYDSASMKMLDVTLYGEGGRLECRFFIQRDSVFNAVVTDYTYNRPIYDIPYEGEEVEGEEYFDDTKTVAVESRYYYSREILIALRSGEEWMDVDEEDSQEYGTGMIDLYRAVLGQRK